MTDLGTIDSVEPSDAMLLRAVGTGDELAFQQLVKRYYARVHRLAVRTLGRSDLVNDVLQEAFLRVWVQAPTWETRNARFYTWLYRVVVNLCIDQCRRPRVETLEAAMHVPDPAVMLDERVAQRQRMERVIEIVDKLPLQQRTALVLCHYEGLSNADAAEVMDLSIKAIESLLVRARRTLRSRLQNCE